MAGLVAKLIREAIRRSRDPARAHERPNLGGDGRMGWAERGNCSFAELGDTSLSKRGCVKSLPFCRGLRKKNEF